MIRNTCKRFAAVRKWRPLQRRRGRSGALRLAEVAGAAVATMADEKPKIGFVSAGLGGFMHCLTPCELVFAPQEGVKTENNEHINLKVAGQDGSVVQFKIKRHTPLSKLMKAYCERQACIALIQFEMMILSYMNNYLLRLYFRPSRQIMNTQGLSLE
ncbi:hypothetical protein GOODEAATRI_012099 [Goodea atripinnis]|uniref:Rad60/SUMO-like domain-containing protein n=1 Tax=Goodea atripinnis TaxID=208336 RepID=A0ABV0NTW9_9TELE